MQRIQQANAACGGHAGGGQPLALCQRLAEKHEVRLGMHPGVAENKGRGDVSHLNPKDLERLLAEQYQTFIKYAGKPTHIKLHGSLYHVTESNPFLRSAYLDFAIARDLPVMALAGGRVLGELKERGGAGIAEGFLDRHYEEDGSLVEREQGGMVATAAEAVERWREASLGLGIRAHTGKRLQSNLDSLCVHSDSPVLHQLFDLLQDDRE